MELFEEEVRRRDDDVRLESDHTFSSQASSTC